MPATGTQPATIGALLTEKNVHLGLEASDKSALIRRLIASLYADSEDKIDEITEAVLEREALLSTGVGYGVALPHAKSVEVDETRMLFAVTKSPIEYQAFDGQPIRLVFLMVGPPRSSRMHIQTLGRISRILNEEEVRNRLLEAETRSEVIDIFETTEAKLTSS